MAGFPTAGGHLADNPGARRSGAPIGLGLEQALRVVVAPQERGQHGGLCFPTTTNWERSDIAKLTQQCGRNSQEKKERRGN